MLIFASLRVSVGRTSTLFAYAVGSCLERPVDSFVPTRKFTVKVSPRTSTKTYRFLSYPQQALPPFLHSRPCSFSDGKKCDDARAEEQKHMNSWTDWLIAVGAISHYCPLEFWLLLERTGFFMRLPPLLAPDVSTYRRSQSIIVITPQPVRRRNGRLLVAKITSLPVTPRQRRE
jgi:hypothetical protein